MSTLLQFEDALPPPIAKRSFGSCYLAKIYYATRKRNSFWGSRSHESISAFPYATSFEKLHERVRTRRNGGQGSTWFIWDVPACAFSAGDRTLLLTDLSSPVPFNRHAFVAPLSIRIGDIAGAFGETGISRFLCPSTDLLPAPLPFICREFYTDGASGGWQPAGESVESSCSLEAAMQVISRLTAWRQSFYNEAQA